MTKERCAGPPTLSGRLAMLGPACCQALTLAAALVVLANDVVLAQSTADIPAQRRSNSVPGGAGSFNPTGPSPDRGLATQPPMPPGGRGSFNPTGPDPGLPGGSYQAMPPGGRGSINPTGPLPDPGSAVVQGAPRGGVLSPRREPPSGPTSRAPVAAGFDNCLAGYSPKRGLSRKEHVALCERIWRRKQPQD